MKKLATIILAAAFVIGLGNNTFAQVQDTEVITLTANLNTTLSLSMETAGITFDFTTLNEYKNGLGNYQGSYESAGSVTSTSNWKLGYKAQGDFLHSDGNTAMPLDNAGVSVEFTGSNPIENNASSDPIALSLSEVILLDYDGSNSNAGDDDANEFVIYWEMGTKEGDMNAESIFEQNLKKGSYSTNVEFIATEVID